MAQDLMHQAEIKDVVRKAYSSLPSGGGRAVVDRLYTRVQLSSLPSGAIDWALGVGNPVESAALSPGEVVLDVGSGGGIDTILAALEVGPSGRAVGIDLLEEMCHRARVHAEAAGVSEWTEFRQGEMEAIPAP